MPDLVTIGGLAVLALSMTAEATLKGTVGEAVKDAYHALKGKIAQWAAADVAALENAPNSASRQAVIAEEIERQSPEDQTKIQKLAIALMDELEKRQRQGPIGIETDRLEAARIHLKNIDVTQGTGIRATNIKTTGDFAVGGLRSEIRRENRSGNR
jgi:hypothetical protein